MVGVVVLVVGLVDEDEVDVRAVVELAPAQLAHADDDEAPRQPLERRAASSTAARRDAQRALGDDVGEIRDLRGGGLERLAAQDVARGDAQDLAALEAAQRVGVAGLVLGLGEQEVGLLGEVLDLGRRAIDLRHQPVEVLGVADQDLGQERRGAHHLDQHVERARIVDQVAQERGAGQAGRGVAREGDDRGVGIGGAADARRAASRRGRRAPRAPAAPRPSPAGAGRRRRGPASPNDAQVLAGLVLGERRREEEIRGRDGGQDGTAACDSGGSRRAAGC